MSVRRALVVPCLLWCLGCGRTSGDEGDGHPDAWMVHVELVGPIPEDLPIVLVSAPDGSLHSLATLNTSGRADVEVPHRGRVSVFTERPKWGELVPPDMSPPMHCVDTYAEVDHELEFRIPTARPIPPPVSGPINFVANGPLPPGTDLLEVSMPCAPQPWNNAHWNEPADPTSPVVVDSIPRCSESEESFALVLARDEKLNVLAVKRVEHVALTPGVKTYEVSFAVPDPVETYTVHFASETGHIAVASRAPSHPYGSDADVEYDTSVYDASGAVSVTIPVFSAFFERHVISVSTGGITRTQLAAEFPPDFTFDPSVLAHTDLLGKIDDPMKVYPVEWRYPEGGRFGACHTVGVRWESGGAFEWRTHQRFRRKGQFTTPELPEDLSSYRMPNALESVSSFNIDTELDCANVADIPWNSTIAAY